MKKILVLSIGILSLLMISNVFALKRLLSHGGGVVTQKNSTAITSCDDITAINGKWIGNVAGGLSTALTIDLEFASPDSGGNSYGSYSYFNGAFAGTLQPLECTQNSDNTITITGSGADANLILNSGNTAFTIQPGSTLTDRSSKKQPVTGTLKRA